MSIQEKKTQSDIDTYIKIAPKFGAILEAMMHYTTSNSTVSRAYIESLFESAVRELIEKPEFAFKYQRNSHGENFNHSICFSVNECVAHGINRDFAKAGDIVSIDTGFSIPSTVMPNRELYFDAAFTVICGSGDRTILTEAPREALEAISMLRGEISVPQISLLIEGVANSRNLQVVNYLTGHGIGYNLHEAPIIPNIITELATDKLLPNTIICPEPMYVDKMGQDVASVYLDSDGWSVMADELSSHWETMFYYDGTKLVDILGISKRE